MNICLEPPFELNNSNPNNMFTRQPLMQKLLTLAYPNHITPFNNLKPPFPSPSPLPCPLAPHKGQCPSLEGDRKFPAILYNFLQIGQNSGGKCSGQGVPVLGGDLGGAGDGGTGGGRGWRWGEWSVGGQDGVGYAVLKGGGEG